LDNAEVAGGVFFERDIRMKREIGERFRAFGTALQDRRDT
jgi:hypothetical protein